MVVVLMILLAWIVVSALTAAVCCVVARGGQLADHMAGRASPSLVAVGPRSTPSPRRPLEGMAEFNG